MTSAAITKRNAVATAIRTNVEALEGAWAVYASPVDVTSLPCVVIGPDEPYRQQDTFGTFGNNREKLRLIGHVFLNRATGNTALDMFDEAFDAVMDAVDGLDYSTRWGDITLNGLVVVGDMEALGGQIPLEVL